MPVFSILKTTLLTIIVPRLPVTELVTPIPSIVDFSTRVPVHVTSRDQLIEIAAGLNCLFTVFLFLPIKLFLTILSLTTAF